MKALPFLALVALCGTVGTADAGIMSPTSKHLIIRQVQRAFAQLHGPPRRSVAPQVNRYDKEIAAEEYRQQQAENLRANQEQFQRDRAEAKRKELERRMYELEQENMRRRNEESLRRRY